MKTPLRLFAILMLMLPAPLFSAPPLRLDLSGGWTARLDPDNRGLPAADADFKPVDLPGTLRDSGLGDPVGPHTRWIGTVKGWGRPVYQPFRTKENFKIPFWLQPERHYLGAAWYRREVEIPDAWRGKRIVLELERPHGDTRLYINGREAGHNDALSTPHEYDVTTLLPPGRHTLLLRLHNAMETVHVGGNAHSVSDHTQSAWHGVVGRIELRAEPAVWIDHLRIEPDAVRKQVRVSATIGRLPGADAPGTLRLTASRDGRVAAEDTVAVEVPPGDAVSLTLDLGENAVLWSEFNPELYHLEAVLETPAGVHTRPERFGLRTFATDGTRITLNGHPLSLRGTLECAVFPLTGYPPTDVPSWRRILEVCRDYGMNHVRFHSWCPPRAAFEAADELGMFLQVECSAWPAVGLGNPVDAWLYREGDRILRAYGNHPSFALFALGNEPGGKRVEYIGPWVEHFASKESRMLVTGGAGWPVLDANEFHNLYGPRIQPWGGGLNSRVNARPPETVSDYREYVEKYPVPIISHEVGQWCVFPDFEEIPKYTGSLKARNFEVFQHQLREAGLLDQARDFLMASGALQVILYKEEVESALRTPGFGGIQLLQLNDFPGQGTALIGVLDAFWDPKPYVDAEHFARFCAPVVPLARLPRRLLTTADRLIADIELYQYGPADLNAARLFWRLEREDGRVEAEGAFAPADLPAGDLHPVGRIDLPLSGVAAPGKLRLVVGVEGHRAENDWDLWVYPAAVPADPQNLTVTQDPGEALSRLQAGERVILFPTPRQVRGDVTVGFSPIFWNTNWAVGQVPNTLGILCDPAHPALAAFPTDSHSNWQWRGLLVGAGTFEMDALPEDLNPIVQVVPDWNHPKKLGLVFEARVGEGQLLVTSMDLNRDLDTRPAARQLRHSLLAYAASPDFRPAASLSPEAFASLFRPAPPPPTPGAKLTADTSAEGHEPLLVMDDDPQTFWHNRWDPPSALPQSLIIELPRAAEVFGISYLPRQDGSWNGTIRGYAVYTSMDGRTWGDPVATGEWKRSREDQLVEFAQPVTARWIRLEARSETGGRPWASAAELRVISGADVLDP